VSTRIDSWTFTYRSAFVFADKSSLLLAYNSYTQEIPSRFKKDVLRAAADPKNDTIAFEGLERVLYNIGAQHHLGSHDLKVLFEEIGNNGTISTHQMAELI